MIFIWQNLFMVRVVAKWVYVFFYVYMSTLMLTPFLYDLIMFVCLFTTTVVVSVFVIFYFIMSLHNLIFFLRYVWHIFATSLLFVISLHSSTSWTLCIYGIGANGKLDFMELNPLWNAELYGIEANVILKFILQIDNYA